MNQFSLMKCFPTWAICNKELITVLAIGPWLLVQAWRGRSGFPRGRPLAMLIAAGLGTELIGNIGVQWGYEVVGLSVMVPGYTGCMLVASALLGGVLLGERVSVRNVAAVGLLIFAFALLGVSSGAGWPDPGRQTAGKPRGDRGGPGFGRRRGSRLRAHGDCHPALCQPYDKLQCRDGHHHGNRRIDARALEFLQRGQRKFAGHALARNTALMFAAGVCNLIAFFALVRGLHLTTVLHVNMINAGQIAIASMLGVLFFGEKCNFLLVMGVGLLITGILAFGSPADQGAIAAEI